MLELALVKIVSIGYGKLLMPTRMLVVLVARLRLTRAKIGITF